MTNEGGGGRQETGGTDQSYKRDYLFACILLSPTDILYFDVPAFFRLRHSSFVILPSALWTTPNPLPRKTLRILAIDIGGTGFKAAVLDADGK